MATPRSTGGNFNSRPNNFYTDPRDSRYCFSDSGKKSYLHD
ncbi:hypothetical protein [Comamonas koreensis]|nr:hypothetical protein [Comamonas koreensis]